MEQFITVCVNNGLGVGSFIALIAYIFIYQKKANDTLDLISKILVRICTKIDVDDEEDRKEKK